MTPGRKILFRDVYGRRPTWRATCLRCGKNQSADDKDFEALLSNTIEILMSHDTILIEINLYRKVYSCMRTVAWFIGKMQD